MLWCLLLLAIWLGCHKAHARAVFAHFIVWHMKLLQPLFDLLTLMALGHQLC
jgi:hypothetical protein